MRTASTIRRTASSVSVKVRMFASGTPWTAEMPNPLAQIASNPASSASLAESASCAPAARTSFAPESGSRTAPMVRKLRLIAGAPRPSQEFCSSVRDTVTSHGLNEFEASYTSRLDRSVKRSRPKATSAGRGSGPRRAGSAGWMEDEDAHALPEPALIRRLRRGSRLALPGEARGVVVLVPDLALLPGRHAARRARARRTAARVDGRGYRPRRLRLRHGRGAYEHPVLPGRRPNGAGDQGRPPGHDDRVRGRPRDRPAGGVPPRGAGDRLRRAEGVRRGGGGDRRGQGPRLGEGDQLPPKRRRRAHRRGGAPHHRAARRAALRHRDLRAGPRLPQIQQHLLPLSLRLALHRAGAPRALYLLPLAAADDRPHVPGAKRRQRPG